MYDAEKSLKNYSDEQWEALCDGCGRCCVMMLEDEDTGEYIPTAVACQYLDIHACRCRIYQNRFALNPGCSKVTRQNIHALDWLPDTCAYKRVSQGRSLPDWHYLVTGNREAVHIAGVSVKNRVISGENIHPDDLCHFIQPE